MSADFKGLIVVLLIGALVFWLAKPIALRFGGEANYGRRRNVWFVLTATAFVSSNFWLYVLVAAPLLIWAGRKDSNPVALYLLLLHVIPSVPVDIPVPGLNTLFPIDNYRLLSLCVLIPTAWRMRKSKDPQRIRGLGSVELALIAFGAIQALLFIPPDLPNHVILHDSLTNDLRETFLFVIDVFVLYVAVSRSSTSRQLIIEAQMAFCLATAIMAAIAIFETVRHWLLYYFLGPEWTIATPFYMFREGALRAQASAGDPLALGYLLAIGFGFWLFLQSQVQSRTTRVCVVALYSFGLLATYSRGPWVGTIVILLVFLFLSTGALTKLLKAASVALIVAFVISLSPLGDRINNMIPFMAHSVDSQAAETVVYRRQLAARSFELIQEHPFFGDQLALLRMEDLRQGQGIIDLVNTYLEITLFYGTVGLLLFLYPVLAALFGAYRIATITIRTDHEYARLGAILVACIVGTLFMIATCSFQFGYAKMFYVLAAFAVAYVHLGRQAHKRGDSQNQIGRSPARN
jgi:O-antigen ligase